MDMTVVIVDDSTDSVALLERLVPRAEGVRVSSASRRPYSERPELQPRSAFASRATASQSSFTVSGL